MSLFILLFAGTMAISLLATLRVKSAYFLWHLLPLLLNGRRSE